MRFSFIALAVILVLALGFQATAAGKSTGERTASTKSSRLVIVGTIGSIYQLEEPCLLKCWGVYVQVVKVLVGKYKESTITFAIHSPGRMGLQLGETYKIEATWKDGQYVVAEGLWPKWPQK